MRTTEQADGGVGTSGCSHSQKGSYQFLGGGCMTSQIHMRFAPHWGLHFIREEAVLGLPRWHSGKESACQCRSHRRHGFNPWVGKIPWRRGWQPTPVFLPGESHGQRGLAGYSPWDCKELSMTEHTHTQAAFQRSQPPTLCPSASGLTVATA